MRGVHSKQNKEIQEQKIQEQEIQEQEIQEQEIQEHVTLYTEHHKRRSIEMRNSLEQQNDLN